MTIFPRELVDDILDYSAGDPRSLKTYSLVSQTWVSRCRSHLFEKCALWPSRIAPFCDLMRSPDCTFLSHVRSITNMKHYGPQDYNTYNNIAADLSRLINVCELEMEFTTPYRPEKLNPFLRTAFPKITRLVVDLKMAQNRTPLASMICLFPALQELDIELTATLEDIPADALPKIHSLRLPCLRGPDVPIVRKALQQIGDGLHHLHLSIHGPSEYSVSEGFETLKMIDLCIHSNLKTLRIHDSSWINSEAQETSLWIPKIIMKLTTPALEHVTLDLDLCRPAYEELDWAALDAFLFPARFPRLRSVVVKCGQHGNHDYDDYVYDIDPDEEPDIDYEHEFVRNALPLLANLELLQTEW
ncbi:hypothetical protein B0H12DRAFT_1233601 [Mycena haematopus]|nr:hypothetical protein B0H12DRAFT_1233601 [Mycena haematopus]